MADTLKIGMMVVAGSVMLSACSRTSDGTVVVPKPVAMPSLNLVPAKPLVPSWMKRKQADPEQEAAVNFPPPPQTRSARRRKVHPPVVTSGAGKLECKNVSQGGRVRMVCA